MKKLMTSAVALGTIGLAALALQAEETANSSAKKTAAPVAVEKVSAAKPEAKPVAKPETKPEAAAKPVAAKPVAATPVKPVAPVAASTPVTAPAAETAVKDYTIVKLNSGEIRYSEVEKVWDDLFPGEGKAPALSTFGDAIRDNIVRGIVSEQLMLEEAKRINLESKPRVQERLEALKKQVLVQELLNERHADLAEANVKKRYDQLVSKMEGKEEIKASHILVESEKEAAELAKKIKGGADFAVLAKELSKDKGSAINGGDLGFFTEDQMVPEFAEAAFKLKKDEVSAPVKSPFGWHVIKLYERRDMPVPTLEEARPQIVKQLNAESDKSYVTQLLKDAKISYFSPEGKELDFPIEQQAITLSDE